MAASTAANDPEPSWQRALARAIRSPDELLRRLGLEGSSLADRVDRDAGFPLRVPEAYVARMREGDPEDPLLLQVLPLRAETDGPTGYRKDPLEETGRLSAPGLLHKYQGRALLTVTGACAVHCRYCFRRHFPYADAGASPGQWHHALRALHEMSDVTEVILSGGDPLSLSDRRIGLLADELAGIPQLKRLRIHTRTPVVLPERVTSGLATNLTRNRLTPVVVVHANHPREIDPAFQAAMFRLRNAGITVLNQTVLLRRVNDDVEILHQLSERLFEAGVLPYYLHALDPVDGAAHFDTPAERITSLAAALRARLPGYLVPRVVREIPGAAGKTPLDC